MVSSAMYYVENKQSRVAACCDLPGDGFFVGARVGGHHHRVEDTMMMQSVGDASVVGNADTSGQPYLRNGCGPDIRATVCGMQSLRLCIPTTH